MQTIGAVPFAAFVWTSVTLVCLVFLFEVYVLVREIDLIPNRSP